MRAARFPCTPAVLVLLMLSLPALAQQFPGTFWVAEHYPCNAGNPGTPRALWINQNGVWGQPAGSWLYTNISSTAVFVDPPSGCSGATTLAAPPVDIGCLDYDAGSGCLFAGDYNPADGSKVYCFTSPPANWSAGFSILVSSGSYIRDQESRLLDGLAVDSDQSLWVSRDLGWHVFHIDQSGNELPGSFVTPFPNSGVEVAGAFLLSWSQSASQFGESICFPRTSRLERRSHFLWASLKV